jgi:glutamyl-Q tRNA(Asp) synthetase
MPLPPYRGRFAPTPSGALHPGSLWAAVLSWLDARHHGGHWHVRIDDLDTPRVVPGAAATILQALDAAGLHWDGPVVYQSQRRARYAERLRELTDHGATYPCLCSRQQIARQAETGWEGPIYPGTCRSGLASSSDSPGHSLRLRAEPRYWQLQDRALGPIAFDLYRLGGDFVVRRAEGFPAYQLATVVDDIDLGVTDVVRGMDLLSSVPRQQCLYHWFQVPAPNYAHHPLVCAADGRKLGKSSGAVAVPATQIPTLVARILGTLGLQDPDTDFLEWSANRSDPGRARTSPTPHWLEQALQHASRHWPGFEHLPDPRTAGTWMLQDRKTDASRASP